MANTETELATSATAAENPSTCRECDGPLRTTDGETWCADCGLVVDEYRLDHAFEPMSFDDGPDRERTGAPLTVARHDRGLSTEIGFDSDAKGRSLPSSKRRQLGRLRKQHSRAKWRTTAERNLAHGLGQVKRVAAVLDIPRSVRDRAAALFRRAQAEALLQGRSVEGMAAASVYAACRDLGVLRTAEEVATAGGTTENRLRHDYGILNVELGLAAPPYSAALFVSRFADAVGVPESVRTRAAAMVRAADGKLGGGRPSSVAAAAIYLAGREAGLGLTQVGVARACGTTDSTVRARTRALEAAVAGVG